MQAARLKRLIDRCTADLRELNQDAEQREMMRCAAEEQRRMRDKMTPRQNDRR